MELCDRVQKWPEKKSAINLLRSELLNLSIIPKAFSQAMPNQVVGMRNNFNRS